MRASWWARLADRIEPVGAIAAVEEPKTVLLIGTAGYLGSALSAAAFAIVFLAFDEPVAGLSTLALAAGFAGVWVWWIVWPGTGRVRGPLLTVLALALANHVSVHVALGGFANSGAYLIFGIGTTLTATLALTRGAVAIFAALYLALIALFGVVDADLVAGRLPPDPALSRFLFVCVLAFNLSTLALLFFYLLSRLASERARAESLLLNVLPAKVASELKAHGQTTARRFDSISVLFADIVGFTPMSAAMDPEEMVAELNRVFTFFDGLVDRYGCEKIRTIGDNYMVACGVPEPRMDHAEALAFMALDMLEFSQGGRLRFRIGINSGPAVAGVIGRRKFQYDVWGDTVNTASRMESHGIPDRVQITAATHELIRHRFRCTPRGTIEVKGKGAMETWFVEGLLDRSTNPAPDH